MEHKFRTQSINAELELLANEFDMALPPQKNDKAEYLRVYMANYPNAELWRALPIVERNLLDKTLGAPVRRKCSGMLGEIGSAVKNGKTTKKVLDLLLIGIGNEDPGIAYSSMRAITKMASERRWQDFDCLIVPLMERIIDEADPCDDPNLVLGALEALEKIKPNDPACLVYADDVKKELIVKKRHGYGGEWEEHIRHMEKVKRGWEQLLVQRGVISKNEKKGSSAFSPKGQKPANVGANAPGRRRIVTP